MPSAARREVRLNTDTNFLKIIAIISMLIDHIGAVFFPQYRVMRIIGRIAFPIFAYCIAVGGIYTRNMGKYMLRIGVLAIISQPIYVLSLNHISSAMRAVSFDSNPVYAAVRWFFLSFHYPNILVSLLAALLLIFTLRERKYILSAAVFILIWYTKGYLNYGLNGIILMLLFYVFCDQPLTSLIWVGGFMIWWGSQGYEFSYTYRVFEQSVNLRFGIQMFAVLALPLIYLPMKTGIKVNKYAFYFFYPLHLLAIYIVLLFVR